jgi:pimeloyl-ACP methyl ester carboxylesterase
MLLPVLPELSHGHAAVNGVHLHYVEAGAGPLVVLLHGFPEHWRCWRYQIGPLAEAGFRVVAPDLRGYNESDRPLAVADYRLPLLVEDVAGLIAHFGAERAAVVGHDWGGVVAWKLAITRPGLVSRLAILNAPHPRAFLHELANPIQLLRSWYVGFFQLPWLPEWRLRFRDCQFLDLALRHRPGRKGAFTAEDIADYKRAFRQPGAATAALNYYRAIFRYPRELRSPDPTVAAPTLLIWGEQDPFLETSLSEGLQRLVPRLHVERFPRAGHWVHVDDPEAVNRLLIDFLRLPE